jgi:hypothetical protein
MAHLCALPIEENGLISVCLGPATWLDVFSSYSACWPLLLALR